MLQSAPELVIEVSASSAAYDLHDKLRAYRRNGVNEYIVWQVLEERIDWFRLEEGEYIAAVPDDSGVIESSVIVFSGVAAPRCRDTEGRRAHGPGRVAGPTRSRLAS
jgi:hypothetical protein